MKQNEHYNAAVIGAVDVRKGGEVNIYLVYSHIYLMLEIRLIFTV